MTLSSNVLPSWNSPSIKTPSLKLASKVKFCVKNRGRNRAVRRDGIMVFSIQCKALFYNCLCRIYQVFIEDKGCIELEGGILILILGSLNLLLCILGELLKYLRFCYDRGKELLY